MTTERLAALALSALVLFAAPSLAYAQREPMRAESVHVVSTHASHTPHLEDSAHLSAPDAGEYVMPVLGIVLGGALVVGGVVSLLGSFLVALGDHVAERHSDTSVIMLGIGLGGIALGAVSVIVSALGIASLRHRAAASHAPNLLGAAVTPIEGGAVATAWGTF